MCCKIQHSSSLDTWNRFHRMYGDIPLSLSHFQETTYDEPFGIVGASLQMGTCVRCAPSRTARYANGGSLRARGCLRLTYRLSPSPLWFFAELHFPPQRPSHSRLALLPTLPL